jgi:predicted Zn-dependent peptidase
VKQQLTSQRVGEGYTRVDHPSGLTILLYPMEGFASAYALFATRYGSVDTSFKTDRDSDFITVPDGIAHFLEHKMFDAKDGDVFERFALTGASANAYTSFDRTAYLFSCTDNFAQSLEILLDFVQNPHFTPEKVLKEQGIIGQEIQMFDDDGDWRVFFNLLGALYHNHPVAIDIAGTIESIGKIDADLLYQCYNTFYNLNNMVLVVTGGFNPAEAIAVADRVLTTASDIAIERRQPPEPPEVRLPRVEQSLEVAVPLFQIGFKAPPAGYPAEVGQSLRCEMLLEILAGEGSELYRTLYDSGLINASFGTEVLAGGSFISLILSGESRDPDAVLAAVKQAMADLKSGGISDADFELARRMLYGRHLGAFGSVRGLGSLLLQAHFSESEAYAMLEEIAAIQKQELLPLIESHLNPEHSAISIVWPSAKDTQP